MSLFDLQDVCIAIGSIATLDLPMVVDLIGIYGLKGPYCTLTTTNWFLQALSVIPRGSWGDVARCFTMIRWASPELGFRSHNGCGPTASCIPEPLRVTQVLDSRFPHGYSAQCVEHEKRILVSSTS
ncbi:acyl-CoA dehydrogenase-related protein [Dorcoceras hygrometricum]|uniref:Acyl-CoA dehydrogenase-related protein n=1 Tax=Dorcoceras hygrometricum TaxID=472368 RepID=A0A2Z7C3Q5_9LAMI|nr:acyl-CoA dehydrogenase-related protein [Dorcoceras hygrometricum]